MIHKALYDLAFDYQFSPKAGPLETFSTIQGNSALQLVLTLLPDTFYTVLYALHILSNLVLITTM